MYEVFVERTAERDLQSLPQAILKRIVPRIKALSDNPRPFLDGDRSFAIHHRRLWMKLECESRLRRLLVRLKG